MEKITFTSVAIFIIFFGVAFIEAIQKNNWIAACLFLALGALSVWADLWMK
ncbi:hypothetical protein HY090_00600 [Candidatus Kaiserbacteria bacterium]|nr:hypothetical protein [Candidatus Kaiserbacteria bacterium]